MKKRRTGRLVGLSIVLVIVVLQFIPVNRSVPEVPPSDDFMAVNNPPENVKILLNDACYDCHSYKTKYPWYAYVAPVSMWLQKHVNEGREHFNMSVWATYDPERADHKLEEAAEETEEAHMPLKSYLWGHPEARLTDEQRELLAGYFEGLRN